MKLSRVIFASCALLLSLSSAAARADLVTNSNFSIAGGTYSAAYGGALYGAPDGWTGTGTFGSDNFNSQGFWDVGTVGGGTSGTVGFLQLGGGEVTSTLSQTINGLKIGGLYSFSFLDNSRMLNPNINPYSYPGGVYPTISLTATIGSFVFTQPIVPYSFGSTPFTQESVDFTATASSETLTFAVTTDQPFDDQGVVITNVDISPTPEPSSLVLLGTGLIGAAAAARRKCRKA